MPKYTNRLKHKSHYENLPFEVPEGWCWSCIENVCSKFTTGPFGSMVHKSDYVIDGGVPMVNPANMIGGNISYNKLMFVSELRAKDLQRYRLEPSDILLARRGDLTKCVVIKEEQKDWLCGTGSFVLHTILLLPTYFELLYSSTYIQSILTSESIGATMDNLNQGLLSSIIIPIPPIEEQKRIVTTVGLWFSLIENLGVGYSELNQNISKAKSKILDLAIHGKLVPQDPNDEPASELLKRINPKFVPCDNPHYEQVPDGWCVCTLEDIVDYEQPQAYIVHSTDYSDSYKIPVLTAGKSFIIGYTNEQDGICDNVPVIIFDDFTTDNKYVDFPFKVKSSAMKILHVNDGINIKYVAYFMSITRLIGDTHKRYWISEYSKVNIPLPPKAEQDRIVTQIERLMCSLDFIAETLV